MRKFDWGRITILSYCILLASIILVALSITEIVLESKVLHVFRNEAIQLPGTSLAEWLFISLNPDNIDSGPSVAIFILGAAGILTAALNVGWSLVLWFRTSAITRQKCARYACVANLGTVTMSLGVLIYVYVTESQQDLPEYFDQWHSRDFTREYYVCDAFPSVMKESERHYGFNACDFAHAARYGLIGVACVTLILTGMTILQAHDSKAFRGTLRASDDVEKARKRNKQQKTAASQEPRRRQHQGLLPITNVSVMGFTTKYGNVKIARPMTARTQDRRQSPQHARVQ